MCKQLSRSEKHLKLINGIKYSQNYHEKKEAMDNLTISLVWSYPRIKETKQLHYRIAMKHKTCLNIAKTTMI